MADTLPATIHELVLASNDVTTQLVIYETGLPSFFQGRPPSNVKGFPFGAFNLANNENPSSSEHYLMVEIDLTFDWWDMHEGHSAERVQNIARAIDLVFDRQRVTTDDYDGMRAWKSGQTLFDETNEEDNVMHLVQRFSLRGYRKYLQTFLTS